MAEEYNFEDTSTPGEGVLFYRCTLCTKVVSPWDIVDIGCCKNCGCTKISPTNLSLWEKIVQVVKHPKVWEWNNAG